MERLSEQRLGREVRSPEEVEVITEYAMFICDGKEAAVEKLIHRVLFEMHDRTWGVSLHEGDPDLPFVETMMVCECLRLASESQRAYNLKKLTDRAVALATKRPHEISLYRSMVFELCRAEDVRVFERALAMRGARLLRMDSEDIRIYQEISGKSYWELDSDMLRRVFISNFLAWRVGMAKLEESEKEEDQHPEFLAEVSVFLTRVRVDLRRIARVVVAKKVLPERKTVGFFRKNTNEDDDSTDIGIDLATARSFLD
jgi:hypothetical protein